MKLTALAVVLFFPLALLSQGIVAGNVLDDAGKPLEGATIQLSGFNQSAKQTTTSDKTGFFQFRNLRFDYYKLTATYVSLQALTIDSIHVRTERSQFNLSDLILKPSGNSELSTVIVYVEKPIFESRDGNISFNASESPQSNSSNVSELLETLPLVTKDPDGKLMVRGREPRILIDDRPVNLTMQQMQDLLESLPGSLIDKIEVQTNPQQQYANEQGGVINIITKKGVVGVSGRLNVFGGTRGEAGSYLNFNYRRSGLVFNVNGGVTVNRLTGGGSSVRQNIFADSTNSLSTANQFTNQNTRPSVRMNVDYDVNKNQVLNLVAQYNTSLFDNNNHTEFQNQNRFKDVYRISTRDIGSDGQNQNGNLSLNYNLKTKKSGESLRAHSSLSFSRNANDRTFIQQFFAPGYIPTGLDSTQQQLSDNNTNRYSLQLSWDRPLSTGTSLSASSNLNGTTSTVKTNASYVRKSDGASVPMTQLSNHFRFYQFVNQYKASLRRKFTQTVAVTAGLSAEQTNISFDLLKTNSDTANAYWSYLPFAVISKNWNESTSLRLTYKRSIRRPGLNELNPVIDFSDPYNLRYGNPALEASTSHNFEMTLGKNQKALFLNVGAAYNVVQDIFSQIRTLQPDGTTVTTWQNISGRKEYQLNTWNGYTFSKKLRVNANASYTFNQYSDYDKKARNFRDGATLTSNINSNYSWQDNYNANVNVTWNRFANPQGVFSNNVRINFGVQGKFLEKKLIVGFNAVDPFARQQNRFTNYGKNFVLESVSFTNSSNFRLSLSYNISRVNRSTNEVIRRADKISR